MNSYWLCAFCFFVLLNLEVEATTDPLSDLAGLGNAKERPVLVLGSGGLIGTALVHWLERHNYEVIHVRNRKHIDLRLPRALDQFNNSNIGFVFFLACEVGGSKFIASDQGQIQLQILENNLLIYQTVFPWLQAHRIPFLFTSSYCEFLHSSYGVIKRLGETWIKSIGFGKIVRLWNVYGYEPIGIKSHVIADWVQSCLREGKIKALTDGHEQRQFMHTSDCAEALGTIMEHYFDPEYETHIDLSNPQWHSLKSIATIISELSPRPCDVHMADKPGMIREPIPPKVDSVPLYQAWTPVVSLRQGIADLFEKYKSIEQENKQTEETTTKKDEL